VNDVTVYGAGAFGTALAISLSRGGQSVTLVARNADTASVLRKDRENKARLSGFTFPSKLRVTDEIRAESNLCLLAIPTPALAGFVGTNRQQLANRPLVACCKGVEISSGLGPTGLIDKACPSAISAILSGPSFAVDVAAGLPSALTLATRNSRAAIEIQKTLSNSALRIYRSNDVPGVEIGGALKNVIAIAAGVTIGAGLGESARAALITRGFAEIRRYALRYGAQPETLSGLSGFGDFILTCTSEKSRNYRCGLALGQGHRPAKNETIEGVSTAIAVTHIAKSGNIDMPILHVVAALLESSISTSQALEMLMSRPLGKE